MTEPRGDNAPRMPLELFEDTRLGGTCQLRFSTRYEIVQISEEIRKCVGFLACKKSSGLVLGGTTFFLGYPLIGTDAAALYAITAKHVIEEIGKHGIDGSSYFRLNRRGGGAESVELSLENWVSHDDPKIDVAVAMLSGEMLQTFDHKMLPLSMFVTRQVLEDGRIGVGEELYFPGLFKYREGTKENMPIIRVGNIAAMPSEEIRTKWGSLRPPYLIEARSIGGLSGSPVLLNFAPMRLASPDNLPTLKPGSYMLGLIHGHYGYGENVWDASDSSTNDKERNSINMGIAIVVPADDIRTVLDMPILQAQREELRQAILTAKSKRLAETD